MPPRGSCGPPNPESGSAVSTLACQRYRDSDRLHLVRGNGGDTTLCHFAIFPLATLTVWTGIVAQRTAGASPVLHVASTLHRNDGPERRADDGDLVRDRGPGDGCWVSGRSAVVQGQEPLVCDLWHGEDIPALR